MNSSSRSWWSAKGMPLSAPLRSNGGNLRRILEKKLRVDARAMPADAEIEMRSGGASRGTDQADRLALPHFLAGRDLDFREMKRLGHEPVAVVDEDGVPWKKEIIGEQDRAVRDRFDGSAGLNGE